MWAMIEKLRMRATFHALPSDGTLARLDLDAAHPFRSTLRTVDRGEHQEPAEAQHHERQGAARNKAAKSELKTRVKKAAGSVGTDQDDEAVRLAVKRLDMAAAKGIIHPNQAARRKSRLMKYVNADNG